ncbi:MAG TPA: histidine phosphatase family protein [Candidatus Limnocylindrales bacterium]|nr:histidine phosphatase family protein [Candidatus Limnocylindrales bacterium]
MTAPLIPADLDATVVLLRHGESMAIVERRFQGQLDTPLSPIGRRQAQLAAARLAHPHATPELPVPLGAPLEIAHSPLSRTTQTAQAVGAAAAADHAFGERIRLRPDTGFLEIGQGEWEGQLSSEIDERWRDILEAWWAHPTETHAPGGESLADVSARVRASIPALLAPLAADGRRDVDHSPVPGSGHGPSRNPWSIVVAHDGVLKVLLLTLFDLPLERFWLFPFALCGITIVDIRSGQPRLRAHNLTDHLAPMLEEQALAVSEERERSGAL